MREEGRGVKLPYFTAAANRNRRQTILFGGVNYSQDTQDGELAESLNLSSMRFPCLSQRAGRKTHATYEGGDGALCPGEVVRGTGHRLPL